MVLGLCDRWSCPPSVIDAEPAERLLWLLSVERLGTPVVHAEVPYGE